MSGKIIEFHSYNFKRINFHRKAALRLKVSRIVALLDELEGLTNRADEGSSLLLWQARAAIGRTREILVSPASDSGSDPQPDIDCTLLERMYRDLNPYS